MRLVNTLHLHMHIGKHCWNSRSSFTARAWRPACLLWESLPMQFDHLQEILSLALILHVFFCCCCCWTSRSARSFVTCRLAIFRAAATYCGSPGHCEGSDVSQSWSLSITLKKDFDVWVTKSARVASRTASPFRSTWTLFGESAVQADSSAVQTLQSADSPKQIASLQVTNDLTKRDVQPKDNGSDSIACKWSNCIGKNSPKQTSGPSCPRCKWAARISAVFTNVHVKMKCLD